MRHAIASASTQAVREELLLAAQMIRNQQGRVIHPDRLTQTLGLSAEAVEGIRTAMPRPDLFSMSFQFDRAEYDKHVTYRSVTLDNGAVLTAENAQFTEVFLRETVDPQDERIRFSTEGRIVNEKLRKGT